MLQDSQYWLGSYAANQKFFEELLSAASVSMQTLTQSFCSPIKGFVITLNLLE
jgi:hypothetical protein